MPEVKLINYSRGGCTYSSVQQEGYRYIRQDLDVLVIASAGNGKGWACVTDSEQYVYPASYDYVTSVSSIGHSKFIGEGIYNWKDVHKRYPLNPNSSTYQHNDKVDIVAPGYDVMTTSNNSYNVSSGTSFSAPMVAGVAGLILSVKPDLTANQIENILKNTADDIYWIPYNAAYIGKLGSGRLNAFRAVKTTECMKEFNPVVDFVVRDSEEDIGDEPNSQTSIFWKSNDIWVRNQDDGMYNETHQNVNYNPLIPNYVNVRITNYGCKNSSGEDQLKVYWSVAGTNQSWPTAWGGSFGTSNLPYGGFIGSETIPQLAPGQEVVLQFEWFPPNPANYNNPNSTSNNFGLLARVVSDDDPISFSDGTNITEYVKQNNNVGWKNINIVDINPLSPKTSASFLISNQSEDEQTYVIEFVEEGISSEKSLYEEAEIGIVLDNIILNKWAIGGSSFENIKFTKSPNFNIIDGINSKLDNISLQPGESGLLELTFNFLTKELTNKEMYEYNIFQRDKNTNEIIGGANILIRKENRTPFFANVEIINNSNSTKLIADEIGESAIYNWYDIDDNLIYSGLEFILNPIGNNNYKLEIISNLDGFKDYKELEISENNSFSIDSIFPNPTNSTVTIYYNAENSSSANLILSNISKGTSENFILNTNEHEATLDLTGYSTGIYVVTLVCNDIVIESRNLIKN